MRSFHRSLVIVPCGTGFCIKNEMVHVNTLTVPQLRTAFKPIAPAPTTAVPQAMAAAPDDATKLQMIQEMSRLSQMNVEWSKQ